MKSDFSINTLATIGLVLPYLLFVVHNRFKRWWLTGLRGLIAVAAGWAYWFSFVLAVDAISRANAVSAQEIQALNDGDGAKFAFAIVFGWVVPALTVVASWLVHRYLLPKLTVFKPKNHQKS